MKVLIDGDTSILNNYSDFIATDDPTYVYSYHGDFDEKFFNDPFFSQYQQYLKIQNNNLIKLTSFLDSINLQLEEMWLTIFRNDAGNISTRFLIKTNTNDEGLTVFWRKYLSRSAGSGQNDVFLVRNEENIREDHASNIRVQLKTFLNTPMIWFRHV